MNILGDIRRDNAVDIQAVDRLGYFRTVLTALKCCPSKTTEGFICEFGIWKGASLSILCKIFSDRTVHAFDSFEGLPRRWRHHLKGEYKVGMHEVKVPKNAVIHKGWFVDTIEPFADAIGDDQISVMHIDCDLYESTKTVLFGLNSSIHKGTIIMFDKYFGSKDTNDHEYKAFMEYCEYFEVGYRYLFYHIAKLGRVTLMIQ